MGASDGLAAGVDNKGMRVGGAVAEGSGVGVAPSGASQEQAAPSAASPPVANAPLRNARRDNRRFNVPSAAAQTICSMLQAVIGY